MKAVILHAAADAAFAKRAAKTAGYLEPLQIALAKDAKVFRCGPGMVAVLIWSASARSARVESAVRAVLPAGCAPVIWVIDDCPAPSLGVASVIVQGDTGPNALDAAVRAASLRMQRTRPARRASSSAALSIAAGIAMGAIAGLGGVGLAAREEVAMAYASRQAFAEAPPPRPLREAGLFRPKVASFTALQPIISTANAAPNAACLQNVLQPVTVEWENSVLKTAAYFELRPCGDGAWRFGPS
jgi:hypothetical protein